MLNKSIYFYSWIILSVFSCISIPKQYKIISPGIWRATLILKDTRQMIVTRSINKIVTRDVHPESTQTVIPFHFDVIYNSDSSFYIEIINGKERIKFDNIIRGHDYKTGNDTMIIHLDPYATQIKCIFENNKMSGEFIVLDKVNYSIPFQAEYGKTFRFSNLPKAEVPNIGGEWQVVFAKDSSDQFNAIGEFNQIENQVTGTFRTETGDFRFLQGDIEDSILKLSAFDGAHAFMFQAEIKNDKMTGLYYSGKHYLTTWEAIKSTSNNLIAADSFTKIKNNSPLQFKLKNTEDKWISLDDPKYINKPKLIQITGSWCPNCRDESEFIVDYLSKNPNLDCEFIAISFERKLDGMMGIDRIKSYKKYLHIPYEVLLGGKNNRDSASLLFPQIDGLRGFPTILYVNRKNQIVKVHTGFDGPATSKFEEYKKEFSESIEKLIKE